MREEGKGRVLVSIGSMDPEIWLRSIGSRREAVLRLDDPADPTIHYALVWKQPVGILSSLPNLKAIFSVGAGVDHIFADRELPDVPIVRVVADNLTQHMTEYVVWRVMDHHRQGILYRTNQSRATWCGLQQPPASDITVGFMGLGNLAGAAARALMALGFNINGWTRRPRRMEGVNCFHGPDGLPAFLAATDMLVVLLPLTPDTEGVINHDLLRQLRHDNALGGAVLINAGRGRLQKDADILRALEDGTLKEASLDVFEEEPLPASSPLWSHPRIVITPHAAANSNPEHLMPGMLAQMDACDRGEPLLNLVDRKAGY